MTVMLRVFIGGRHVAIATEDGRFTRKDALRLIAFLHLTAEDLDGEEPT